jgi:hypothetical protein
MNKDDGYIQYLELLKQVLIKVDKRFNLLTDNTYLIFSIQWLLCLFTQNITNPYTVQRVLDYLIFSHPLMIYVISAVVCYKI